MNKLIASADESYEESFKEGPYVKYASRASERKAPEIKIDFCWADRIARINARKIGCESNGPCSDNEIFEKCSETMSLFQRAEAYLGVIRYGIFSRALVSLFSRKSAANLHL